MELAFVSLEFLVKLRDTKGFIYTYIHPLFCYYNTILEAGYFIRKRGLFWLSVLEMQGLGATSGDSLLAGRILKWYNAPHGKTKGAHMCMCVSSGFSSFSDKAIRIQY